jgi:F-box/TPR repeat protein Pof3
MKLCLCSRGMKRDRCACKDFEKTALENRSIFHEAMYTCTCSVGNSFSKCDRADHIRALDYRAATWESMGELARARKDAEWILELAPRLPDGYLRMGKVACLQKNYEFAWKIYNAGIDASSTGSVSELPKLRQLHSARAPLQIRFVRKNPVDHLPAEMSLSIFSLLDFNSLVRCLRVSKAWSRVLVSHDYRRLWRSLIFTDRQVKVQYAAEWLYGYRAPRDEETLGASGNAGRP